MNLEKFKKFKVKYYSKDGKDSPVFQYLIELFDTSPNLAKEALYRLIDLPKHFYLFNNIKIFKHGKIKCYELKVKRGSDICRFFFKVEEPNYIIIYGFTKKTQKTDKKDIKQGERNFKDYENNKIAIYLDSDISNLL